MHIITYGQWDISGYISDTNPKILEKSTSTFSLFYTNKIHYSYSNLSPFVKSDATLLQKWMFKKLNIECECLCVPINICYQIYLF